MPPPHDRADPRAWCAVAVARLCRDQPEAALDAARQAIDRDQHGEWGHLEQPGAMWFFGDQEVRLDRAPPLLGEHTVEVLLEVGMSRDEIDEALAAGAVVQRG